MNINVPWCPCGSIGAPDVVEEDELCQNALDRFERQQVNFMHQPNITQGVRTKKVDEEEVFCIGDEALRTVTVKSSSDR